MGKLVHFAVWVQWKQQARLEGLRRTQLPSPAVNWGSKKLKALCFLISSVIHATKVNQRSCFSAPYEPPQITLLSWEDGKATLQCKSRGGYPQAEITWHDGNGNQLNQSEPAELWRSSEGVFEVQSRLVVTGPEDRSFCCSLIHAPLNQNFCICERVTGNSDKPMQALWVKSSQRPSLTTQDRQNTADMQPPLGWKAVAVLQNTARQGRVCLGTGSNFGLSENCHGRFWQEL